MIGSTHRIFGALAGATAASLTGHNLGMVAMTAVVATATSNGWPSPDIDQCGPWRTAAKVAGPFRRLFTHRHGLSHWWGLPVVVWVLAVPRLPGDAQWAAVALLIGWVSHLVGDFLFGTLSLFPWGGPRFGLGLRTDGFAESGRWRRWRLPVAPARVAIAAALGWVLWTLPRWPHVPLPWV